VDGSIACLVGAPRLAWPSVNLSLTISSLSTVYVQVPVRAYREGQPYNPTGDPVSMAFLAGWDDPDSGDWHTASWGTSEADTTFLAQLLVGPGSGGLALGAGAWSIWVKITDSPEVPVMQPGQLTIT
jgi:hypothetical protein